MLSNRIPGYRKSKFHEDKFMTLAMVFGSGSPLIVSKTRAFFLTVRQFAEEENLKSRYLDKLYNDSLVSEVHS